MEALGSNGGQYEFAAKPQVIKRQAGPYRDPYREYM